MAEKMKLSERMDAVRKEAIEALQIPEFAREVAANEFAWNTSNGPVRVKVTAIKSEDFDIDFEADEFARETAEKARIKDEKAEKAAKEKAAKIALQEARKAEKAAKA